MIHHSQVSPGATARSQRRAFPLLAFLATLALLVFGLHLLLTAWLANFTVKEWRDAPAGSQLDILFDEPAHPPWSW
jgi:hypothetical protein